MTSIAAIARLGLECYNYEPKTQTVYLLNNRANALEHLDRYEEVQALTDLFFERFFDAADGEHRGRWYMRALYLDLRAGRYEEAADNYRDARRYDEALPLAQRAALRNNGTMLRIRSGNFERAAGLASEGIALLDSTYQTRDEALELARLLQNRGHARLERYNDDSTLALLEPARLDLHAAITLRDSLSITERQAEAYVTLGEIYHGLGDGPTGRGYMGTGLRLAREGGNPRGEIFALWRTGRMSRRSELLSLGSQQLQEALRLSEESGVGEFKLFIQLELARLFEDREAWRQAEDLYRAIVETPDEARYRSNLYDGAKARDEAERRGMNARMHLAEAETSRLRLVLFGAVLLLMLVSGAALTQRRRFVRLRSRFAVLKNGTPKGDDLFERRMRYAKRILLRPKQAALLVDDPALAVRVARSGLEHRMQLYEGICALEKAIDKRIVHPKNLGHFLWENFGKRGWNWPDSIEAWHLHFTEHPDGANLADD